MNDEEREKFLDAMKGYTKIWADGQAGIGFAINILVRELIQQKVLDKKAFLASLRECRVGLVKADTGRHFDAALQAMTQVVLTSGDDAPPDDWISKMIPPPTDNR